MSDFLDDIAEYLADNGVGSIDAGEADIFAGVFPNDPDNAVGIFGLPGDAPDSSIADLLRPRFQILVRNSDYNAASDKISSIRDLLHVKIGLELSNFYVMRCHAAQEAQPIGEDESGRSTFSVNFRAQARAT